VRSVFVFDFFEGASAGAEAEVQQLVLDA
jgi:hypothetical protein